MFYRLFIVNCCLLFVTIFAFEIHENADACVDSCGSVFDRKFDIDLKTGKYDLIDSYFVEVIDNQSDSGTDECDGNALLRIPMFDLEESTIVKIELDYASEISGLGIHIGNSANNDLNGGDRNTSVYNTEVYTNDSNIYVYKNSRYLCDKQMPHDRSPLLNHSTNFLYSNQQLNIYVSNKWLRIDNLETNSSQTYDGDYLFRFHNAENDSCGGLNKNLYLYIGLNRAINDKYQTGNGICAAKISFVNCESNQEPDIDVDVDRMNYINRDNSSIEWVDELRYLDISTSEHTPCSGEGVFKLKFEPNGTKKLARFDLELGDNVSGFTFNIGDSPTNNGYGGDTGTTSNSAEIHSNDNRFYVWLNPKFCGDTLLHTIEYGIFYPNDIVTLFVSDQRLEISNNRDYHEIVKNVYLYNLNGEPVTCNCFDTRCYPGVSPDNDLYIGINRVIGGTYRPGVGLCRAKVNWLQCKNNIRKPKSIQFETITATEVLSTIEDTTEFTTTSTTTTATATTVITTTTITIASTTTLLPSSQTATITTESTTVTSSDETETTSVETITTTIIPTTTTLTEIKLNNSTQSISPNHTDNQN